MTPQHHRPSRASADAEVRLRMPHGLAGFGTGQTPRARRKGGTLLFLTVSLALALGYLLFTLACMVPQARSHVLDLLIHPAPAHFLKGE